MFAGSCLSLKFYNQKKDVLNIYELCTQENARCNIYNICKFIYTNGNCKNCEEGRFHTVMIQDKEIPYCFSDFQRNESETSIRVGLHVDLLFSENCKNKKINISDIEPILIESIPNTRYKNNHQNKQENQIISNLDTHDTEEYAKQNNSTFDYSNAVKKNIV